jgi:hypothetical protein
LNIATAIVLAIGASAAAANAPAEPPAAEGASPQVEKLLQNCDAHKFETVVDAVVDGHPHKSRVKLCGQEGQSDADWIGTLKDAIAKLNANSEMDPPVRAQIVSAITAEIARLQMMADLSAPKARQTVAETARPLSNDYSSLPPLPAAPPPPKVLAPAAVAQTSPAATMPAASASVAMLPSAPPPKLSFACYSPGDLGGDAPCTGFDRDTMLTIRAGADIPSGVGLRFVRNGDARVTVELAQLRRGKSLRIALPRDVCAGVGDGKLELQVLQNGAPVSTDGPYSLRC